MSGNQEGNVKNPGWEQKYSLCTPAAQAVLEAAVKWQDAHDADWETCGQQQDDLDDAIRAYRDSRT